MSETPSIDEIRAAGQQFIKSKTDWTKKNEEFYAFVTNKVSEMEEKFEDLQDSFDEYETDVQSTKKILSQNQYSRKKESIETDFRTHEMTMKESTELIDTLKRVAEEQGAIKSTITLDISRYREANIKQELTKLKLDQLKRRQVEEEELASLARKVESMKIEDEIELANAELEMLEGKDFTSDLKIGLHVNEKYNISEFKEEQGREIMKIFSRTRSGFYPRWPKVTCAVTVIDGILHTFFRNGDGHAEKHLLDKLTENAEGVQRDNEGQKKAEKFEPCQEEWENQEEKNLDVYVNYSPCDECKSLFDDFFEKYNTPKVTLVFVRQYYQHPVPPYARQFKADDWCYFKGLLYFFQNTPFQKYRDSNDETMEFTTNKN